MRLVHLLVAAVASTVAVIAVQYLRPNEAVKTRVVTKQNDRCMTIVPRIRTTAMSPLEARSVRVPERLAPKVVRRTK